MARLVNEKHFPEIGLMLWGASTLLQVDAGIWQAYESDPCLSRLAEDNVCSLAGCCDLKYQKGTADFAK
jgi:hypothetical protein